MSDLQEVCRQLRMTRDADERHHREIVAALARIERLCAPTPVVTLNATTADPLGQYEEGLRAVREERDALVETLLASQARVRELEAERDSLCATRDAQANTIGAYQARVHELDEERAALRERVGRQAENIGSYQRRVDELTAERDRSRRNYADLETAVLARGYTITWTLDGNPDAPRVRLEPAFALSPELAAAAAEKRASAAERKLAAAEARIARLEQVRDNLFATRDALVDANGKVAERAEEDRRRLTALSNAIVGLGYDIIWDLRAGELPSIRLTSRWERWP